MDRALDVGAGPLYPVCLSHPTTGKTCKSMLGNKAQRLLGSRYTGAALEQILANSSRWVYISSIETYKLGEQQDSYPAGPSSGTHTDFEEPESFFLFYIQVCTSQKLLNCHSFPNSELLAQDGSPGRNGAGCAMG
jgi:hypothetical protein